MDHIPNADAVVLIPSLGKVKLDIRDYDFATLCAMVRAINTFDLLRAASCLVVLWSWQPCFEYADRAKVVVSGGPNLSSLLYVLASYTLVSTPRLRECHLLLQHHHAPINAALEQLVSTLCYNAPNLDTIVLRLHKWNVSSHHIVQRLIERAWAGDWREFELVFTHTPSVIPHCFMCLPKTQEGLLVASTTTATRLSRLRLGFQRGEWKRPWRVDGLLKAIANGLPGLRDLSIDLSHNYLNDAWATEEDYDYRSIRWPWPPVRVACIVRSCGMNAKALHNMLLAFGCHVNPPKHFKVDASVNEIKVHELFRVVPFEKWWLLDDPHSRRAYFDVTDNDAISGSHAGLYLDIAHKKIYVCVSQCHFNATEAYIFVSPEPPLNPSPSSIRSLGSREESTVVEDKRFESRGVTLLFGSRGSFSRLVADRVLMFDDEDDIESSTVWMT